MRGRFRLEPGWIALVVAAGVVIAALTALARSPSVPDPGPAAVLPPHVGGDSFVHTLRDRAAQLRVPPDPFRPDPASTSPASDPVSSDGQSVSPPPYVPPPPQVVGTGRRPDGIAFIGCEVPGRGILLVRQGEACGVFELIDVGRDSVRFSIASMDSLLSVPLERHR